MQFRILGPVEALDLERPGRIRGGSRCGSSVCCSCAAASPSPRTAPSTRCGASGSRPIRPTRCRSSSRGCGPPSAPRAVTWQGGGYALQLDDPDAVDADRFSLTAEGEAALAGGDPAVAARALHAALGAVARPGAARLRYESFAAAEVARLDELRLTCLGARIEADLALGRHEGVLGELAALVAEHPLRESFRLQLVRALSAAVAGPRRSPPPAPRDGSSPRTSGLAPSPELLALLDGARRRRRGRRGARWSASRRTCARAVAAAAGPRGARGRDAPLREVSVTVLGARRPAGRELPGRPRRGLRHPGEPRGRVRARGAGRDGAPARGWASSRARPALRLDVRRRRDRRDRARDRARRAPGGRGGRRARRGWRARPRWGSCA